MDMCSFLKLHFLVCLFHVDVPCSNVTIAKNDPVTQMSITCLLLLVGSSMIALFKALTWLYNTYYI